MTSVSSSPSPSSDCSWIDIIPLKDRVSSSTSAIVLPFTADDIIDADDWLMEQPCPPMRMSFTTSPSKRSEEHTSELQSLMRISYAVFCLKKKRHQQKNNHNKAITNTTEYS